MTHQTNEQTRSDVYALMRVARRLILEQGLQDEMDVTYGALTSTLNDMGELVQSADI